MFCGNCTMNAMSTYEKEISTQSNTYTFTTLTVTATMTKSDSLK